MFELGSLVRSTHKAYCPDQIGVCYEVYDRGDGTTGFSFIFESGANSGFEPESLWSLKDLGLVDHTLVGYEFKNVIELNRDFLKGRFNRAFRLGRLKIGDPEAEKKYPEYADAADDSGPRCTDGHGQTCQTSQHPDCRCACHGKNHGTHPQLFP